MKKEKAIVGFGSNLGNRQDHLKNAKENFLLSTHFELLKQSSLYETKPWGKEDQPLFLNAALLFATDFAPLELLDFLQAVEKKEGRVREEKWGPRTLDLDLLLYDNTTLKSERLILPHPFLTQRSFVLKPLMEIAPEWEILPSKKAKDFWKNDFEKEIRLFLSSSSW